MPGRPPLCLKCKSIVHLRKDCHPPGYFNTVRSKCDSSGGATGGDGDGQSCDVDEGAEVSQNASGIRVVVVRGLLGLWVVTAMTRSTGYQA